MVLLLVGAAVALLSRRCLPGLGLGSTAAWVHGPAAAWPAKPVKITTAASTGSGSDVPLRLAAARDATRADLRQY